MQKANAASGGGADDTGDGPHARLYGHYGMVTRPRGGSGAGWKARLNGSGRRCSIINKFWEWGLSSAPKLFTF